MSHHYRTRVAYGLILITVMLLSTGCFNYGISESSNVSPSDSVVDTDAEKTPPDNLPTAGLSISPSEPLANKDMAQFSGVESATASGDEQMPSEVLERIIEAIAQDLGQPVANLTVASMTAHTWPDGCLGLAGEDELCTMALIEGWQVNIKIENTSYTYRSNAKGTAVRKAY